MSLMSCLCLLTLSQKEHSKVKENKIDKNVGFIHKSKSYLGNDLLLACYYPYICSYINYANLLLVSASGA